MPNTIRKLSNDSIKITIALFILLRRVISHPAPSVFVLNIIENVPEEFRELRAQKKRGTFSPSLDALRSSTTYISQLQRVKPTP